MLPAMIAHGLFNVACFSGGLALAVSMAVGCGMLPKHHAFVTSTDTDVDVDANADVNTLTRGDSNNESSGDPQAANHTLSTSTDRGVFDRDQVLNDHENRIADEFSIPAGLRGRVGFWFDVYTKYDSNRRVIHHSRFPWIIYKVIDVSPIIFSDTPKFRWMRNEKADKFVKAEVSKIRKALSSIARKKDLGKLNEYESIVVGALSKLDGPVQKNARLAADNVRIQTGQKDFFISGLEVSPRYLGTMEKIFESHRLPTELTRLPFVESSFNKHATSKVGASGIWQFMGNTGRKFMRVDDNIDERRSPFKSTEAAALLLKENHLILHKSWPLAITAWNHGPSGVRRAMRAAGSQDLSVIVAKHRSKSFDFASSNFYSEFLAALHAEKYNDLIYGPITQAKAWDLHSVKLRRSVAPREIIRLSGLSSEDFLLMNPDLRKAVERNRNLPAGLKLLVPEEAKAGIERLIATEQAGANRRS